MSKRSADTFSSSSSTQAEKRSKVESSRDKIRIRYEGDQEWHDEISTGGLVVRLNEGHVEGLLIRAQGKKRFELPKGHVEIGEDLAKTAHREIAEEAGVTTKVEILGEISNFGYSFQRDGESFKCFKIVHYYLCGNPTDWSNIQLGPSEDKTEEVCWFRFTDISLQGEEGVVPPPLKSENYANIKTQSCKDTCARGFGMATALMGLLGKKN